MKAISFVISILMTVGYSYSQGMLSFFTKEGEKFWVIIDGKKINQDPHYLVENIPVNTKWGKAKIIFEDPKLGSVDKTYQVVDVDGNWCHVKYMIRKNPKKGKYEIRDIDATFTILQNPPASQVATTPAQSQPAQQQIQTTTTPANNNSNNLNMNVTINESPSSVQIQTGITGIQQSTVVTHQVTTTTMQTTTVPMGQLEVKPASSSSTGCQRPMADADFQSALNSIKSKSFEDAKLNLAKQIASSNCLLSVQVRDIMKAFGFETSRLEFAKFAYTYTYDKNNYFKVNDAFSFESSIDELNEYLQTVK